MYIHSDGASIFFKKRVRCKSRDMPTVRTTARAVLAALLVALLAVFAAYVALLVQSRAHRPRCAAKGMPCGEGGAPCCAEDGLQCVVEAPNGPGTCRDAPAPTPRGCDEADARVCGGADFCVARGTCQCARADGAVYSVAASKAVARPVCRAAPSDDEGAIAHHVAWDQVLARWSIRSRALRGWDELRDPIPVFNSVPARDDLPPQVCISRLPASDEDAVQSKGYIVEKCPDGRCVQGRCETAPRPGTPGGFPGWAVALVVAASLAVAAALLRLAWRKRKRSHAQPDIEMDFELTGQEAPPPEREVNPATADPEAPPPELEVKRKREAELAELDTPSFAAKKMRHGPPELREEQRAREAVRLLRSQRRYGLVDSVDPPDSRNPKRPADMGPVSTPERQARHRLYSTQGLAFHSLVTTFKEQLPREQRPEVSHQVLVHAGLRPSQRVKRIEGAKRLVQLTAGKNVHVSLWSVPTESSMLGQRHCDFKLHLATLLVNACKEQENRAVLMLEASIRKKVTDIETPLSVLYMRMYSNQCKRMPDMRYRLAFERAVMTSRIRCSNCWCSQSEKIKTTSPVWSPTTNT